MSEKSHVRHLLTSESEEPSDNHADTQGPQNLSTESSFQEFSHHKSGGRGTIYRAKHVELHRYVAVKRLQFFSEDDAKTKEKKRARFRLEAEATSLLDHPGVPPVYCIGETEDEPPYYVMRFISGKTLEEEINAYHKGARQENDACRRQFHALLRHLVSAAKTIAYAHKKSILNLDVKPRNIMVDNCGETIVIDWGESVPLKKDDDTKDNEDSLPVAPPPKGKDESTRTAGGTRAYMAPERFDSGRGSVGVAADIYSLGVSLYRLLTGDEAFADASASKEEVERRITSGEFVRPSAKDRRVPAALEAICLKAMALQVANRYQSALDFADDIQRWLDDEPVTAHRESLLDTATRWSRRHRTSALCIAAFLIATAASVVIFTSWKQAQRADALRAQADKAFDRSLATFEKLTLPLANEERNQLDVFRPMAQEIIGFANTYLNEYQAKDEASLRTARVLELRATGSRFQDSEDEITKHVKITKNDPLDDLRQAERIYKALISSSPDETDFRRQQAFNWLVQGRVLLDRADPDAALTVLQQARVEFLELGDISEPSERPNLKRRLAETNHVLGQCYWTLARRQNLKERYVEASEYHFKQSRQSFIDLDKSGAVEGSYEQDILRRDLALSHGYLGDLYLGWGNAEEAKNEYNASLDIRRQLVARDPRNPEHRFQLARGLANFAMVARVEHRDVDNTIKDLEEARTLMEELYWEEEFKGHERFGLDLGWRLLDLAELHLFQAADLANPNRAHHLEEAHKFSQEAHDVFEALNAKHPSVLRGIALGCAMLAEAHLGADKARAQTLARRGMKKLDELVDETRTHEDFFTKALLLGCLDRPSEAMSALNTAVMKGSKTVLRFEMHRKLGPLDAENFEEVIDEAGKESAPRSINK